MKQAAPGILFALLWASASVAGKFGLAVSDPLILANTRFFIAGGLMLILCAVFRRGKRMLPAGSEWKNLAIFSLLNTTIYLGGFTIALTRVSAGIGSLSTATNPLLIVLISAAWSRRKLNAAEATGIGLGISGVAMATYPLLQDSHATVTGLIILFGSMISVSAATVFYSKVSWGLSDLAFNGWQVLAGGILLLPVTILFADSSAVRAGGQFWGSVFWLVVPVSVIALQLWFFLIRQDAVQASLWLFLCPIFGFFYSWLFLNEPLTAYTFAGTGMVIAGLYLAKYRKRATAILSTET